MKAERKYRKLFWLVLGTLFVTAVLAAFLGYAVWKGISGLPGPVPS